MSIHADLTTSRTAASPLPLRADDPAVKLDYPETGAPAEPATEPFAALSAPAVRPGARSQPSKVLTRPRRIPSWLLIALVIGTCAISAAPTLRSNAIIIAEGSPTAYLALVPLWVLAIALTTDRSPRRHDVSDSDIDRILATLIATLTIACCQLVLNRLGAVGEFWHAHLVSVFAWVVALSILTFGSRSAVRIRLAWGFLLACFPPFFLLAGQALGGTVLAYGALTALYGAVATYLTLRGRPTKWIAAPAYFTFSFAGTYFLQHVSPPIGYLAPAATLTVLTVGLVVRTTRHHGPAVVPAHSLLSVAVVLALSVLVGVMPHHPVSHTPRSDLTWVRSDWITHTSDAGMTLGQPEVFAWGPRVMGDGGSVVRYPLRSGRDVAFLDVFSTREYGRLTDYCCGLWYATSPPPDVERSFISSEHGISQAAEMGNQYSPPQKPGDPSWHAHQWLWRYRTASDVVYQAVYLVASRDPKAPENVATPQPPTLRTGILQPLAALIQDHASLHTPTPYDAATLDALTRRIIATAQAGAPR